MRGERPHPRLSHAARAAGRAGVSAAEKGGRRGRDPDLGVGAPLEVVVDLHRASVVRLGAGPAESALF